MDSPPTRTGEKGKQALKKKYLKRKKGRGDRLLNGMKGMISRGWGGRQKYL